MYREILKFGAMIVDSLLDYKQPVFIYNIGELRGGAWVVLDRQINPEMIEMYAKPDARGGVLEPEGIVEVKFRKNQILHLMEMNDDEYARLKNRLNDVSLTRNERLEIAESIRKREDMLYPIYQSVACDFADLHDKPGRMLRKGVIRKIVDWEQSRSFFYWRLARRLKELEFVQKASLLVAHETTKRKLEELLSRAGVDTEDDREVLEWMTSNSDSIVSEVNESAKEEVKKKILAMADQFGGLEALGL